MLVVVAPSHCESYGGIVYFSPTRADEKPLSYTLSQISVKEMMKIMKKNMKSCTRSVPMNQLGHYVPLYGSVASTVTNGTGGRFR